MEIAELIFNLERRRAKRKRGEAEFEPFLKVIKMDAWIKDFGKELTVKEWKFDWAWYGCGGKSSPWKYDINDVDRIKELKRDL